MARVFVCRLRNDFSSNRYASRDAKKLEAEGLLVRKTASDGFNGIHDRSDSIYLLG